MSPLPYTVSLDEFQELLRRFPFDRTIDSVQLRGRTELPNADSDCHVLVTPDGVLLNRGSWHWRAGGAAPRSRLRALSPFLVDAICGADGSLPAFQRNLVLQVAARVLLRFGLAPEDVHSVVAAKANGHDAVPTPRLKLTPKEIAPVLQELKTESPVSLPADRDFPFPGTARSVWTLIDEVRSNGHARPERSAAATTTADSGFPFPASRGVPLPAPAATREPEPVPAEPIQLTPDVQQDLRAHVINLAQGRFSMQGWKTPKEDVDTIFRKHIPEWAASRPVDEKLKIVIYAHGGLVSEKKGLEIAAKQLGWWKDNGVYPLFFVWETGLMETLSQLLNPNRQRAIDLAAPTDYLLENLARAIGGVAVWSGMKRSAERASDADGGARYVGGELSKLFGGDLATRLELHAVGHSAGSIFHGHFINAAIEMGVPRFNSLSLLAPAITVDGFKQLLLPRMADKAVARTTMFTMSRPYELDDNCAQVYRKSLLYLVRAAFEPEPRTPILGLEESIRQDPDVMRAFDPDGAHPSRLGEIVFSVTKDGSARSSSQSTSHGGFDDDKATMESVARRILDRDDIKPFPVTRALPEESVLPTLPEADLLARLLRSPSLAAAMPIPAPAATDGENPDRGGGGGRKRALCIGIDRYRDAPLSGCVNDARQWETAFKNLGFTTETLLDEQATRDAMLGRITSLVTESRAGDVVVVQYAGHGTQLEDLNGDEDDSYDEALCPIDYPSGRFLIDDDLADVFDRIPDGVNVTVFTDCCHSGTITRLALGVPSAPAAPSSRARFIVATPELEAAHKQDRERMALQSRAPKAARPYLQAREVLFCACRANEVAMESNGHGDFTIRAVPLLARGAAGMTHEQFEDAVLDVFGSSPRQHPELHCSEERKTGKLFVAPESGRPAPGAAVASPASERAKLRHAFEVAAESLR
ncbi:hypothetical protein DB347_01865 [Opitutaceae bacterium EW11]|nr:hypothetical protein DB347_01865 [Opitutaceae bacterium EW11]